MSKVVSCGVAMLNSRHELFVCHTTGTPRWDLPKGIQDPGESALETAVRETWEETALVLDPTTLTEVGAFDYLPAKRLHLFAMRVAADAFDPRECRCHSTFPHRSTGLPIPEVDGYAWKSVDRLHEWCGKNMTRVLTAIDWPTIERLRVIPNLPLRLPSLIALDDGPFFRGTKAVLRVGNLLTAGFTSNYREGLVMNHIYFTAMAKGAGLAAEIARGEGKPHVYIVEPTGDFENDPNVTDKKFPGNPTRSYRSALPLKVVGEIDTWELFDREFVSQLRRRIDDGMGEIIN